MADIGKLQSVNLQEISGKRLEQQVKKSQGAQESASGDFGKTISDFIMAVNADQKNASTAVNDVILGKSENLHEAMASLEESRLSFQLMVEVRNKLLEGYKTLERMQV